MITAFTKNHWLAVLKATDIEIFFIFLRLKQNEQQIVLLRDKGVISGSKTKFKYK